MLRSYYFQKIIKFHEEGYISDDILKEFFEKLPSIDKLVYEVEKAFELSYPPIVFDPNLIIIKYPLGFTSTVIYASTKIQNFENEFKLCIELTLPFALFANNDLIKACLAHEFLHYIFITIVLKEKSLEKLVGIKPLAPEVFLAFDNTHLVKPEEWIKDKELIKLIEKYFNPIINDIELEEKIKEFWINKSLPIKEISIEESMIRIPILELNKVKLNNEILRRIGYKE
ncbi:MAG: hypothetical protein HA493_02300 [Candidatus Verstraetearchaeota archaeon]|nr:hypothetical protein [Candidatus Verstraetearchaeota archaeon]